MLSCHLGQTHAKSPHVASYGVMSFYVQTTSTDAVPFDAKSLSVHHALRCVTECTSVQSCSVVKASSGCVIKEKKRHVLTCYAMTMFI